MRGVPCSILSPSCQIRQLGLWLQQISPASRDHNCFGKPAFQLLYRSPIDSGGVPRVLWFLQASRIRVQHHMKQRQTSTTPLAIKLFQPESCASEAYRPRTFAGWQRHRQTHILLNTEANIATLLRRNLTRRKFKSSFAEARLGCRAIPAVKATSAQQAPKRMRAPYLMRSCYLFTSFIDL